MRIAEIVHYMQQREYRKANDSYLQLSIGNAPWPIGVTAVGYVRRRCSRQHPRALRPGKAVHDECRARYVGS
ncbi:hypothetical protein GLX27_004261 [Malassezia furfur]|uniref:Pre-mRNA-splicing factor 18 n=1 Tax=Malassezia furfur TaxID=55194 RepID=A0ABY8F1G5_MALFU|nr:hypothetical protein GLX27_004261 [Malassezia furfur]